METAEVLLAVLAGVRVFRACPGRGEVDVPIPPQRLFTEWCRLSVQSSLNPLLRNGISIVINNTEITINKGKNR